ncbi:MAG: hypothetical protein KC668_16715 [Myxococcales bacterium]|nr:hypothetical protein [Myxococcales bacterium]
MDWTRSETRDAFRRRSFRGQAWLVFAGLAAACSGHPARVDAPSRDLPVEGVVEGDEGALLQCLRSEMTVFGGRLVVGPGERVGDTWSVAMAVHDARSKSYVELVRRHPRFTQEFDVSVTFTSARSLFVRVEAHDARVTQDEHFSWSGVHAYGRQGEVVTLPATTREPHELLEVLGACIERSYALAATSRAAGADGPPGGRDEGAPPARCAHPGATECLRARGGVE